MTTPNKPRMIFATKTAQQLPFTLGGLTFTSRRLTAEEDLVYEDLKLRANFLPSLREQITDTVGVLAVFLGHRAGQPVAPEWVGAHLNATTEGALMGYLRTGHNGPGLVPAPGTTFDLPVIELEIEGRRFSGPVMSYADLLVFSDALPGALIDEVQDLDEGGMTAAQVRLKGQELTTRVLASKRATADAVAAFLTQRDVNGEDGTSLTGQWLLDRLSREEFDQLQDFIRTGEMAGETPNADLAPENAPIFG